LFFDEGDIRLEDLGSTNGTFVNGQRVRDPLALHSGDIIQLGTKLRLRFTSLEDEDFPETLMENPNGDADAPSPPAGSPPGRSFSLWLVVGLLGFLVLCVVMVVLSGGGWFAFNRLSTSRQETAAANQQVSAQTQTSVSPTTVTPTIEDFTATPSATREEAPTADLMATQAVETVQAQATRTGQAQATADEIDSYRDLVATALAGEPIFGPSSGWLGHGDGSKLVYHLKDLSLMNFVATMDLQVPYQDPDHAWDGGIFFRIRDKNDEFRLVISSDGSYFISSRVGTATEMLASGSLEAINLAEGGVNHFVLVVADDRAVFFLNDVYVTDADLSDRMTAGDLAVVTNVQEGHFKPWSETYYEHFYVYALPQ
jgi:pSer/pThr/pTyr-binding forkhead associated (FHA) protein